MAVVRRVDLVICGEQWASHEWPTVHTVISGFTRASSSRTGWSV